jgi:peptidoglycan/LPS O-acetylase OafA/YrhL
LGFWQTLILALLFTTALAFASWHLIEKQALKFKPQASARMRLRTLKNA